MGKVNKLGRFFYNFHLQKVENHEKITFKTLFQCDNLAMETSAHCISFKPKNKLHGCGQEARR